MVLDRERVVGRDGGLARGDLAVEDLGLLLHLPRDALEVELVALELGARALRGALRVDGALVPGQKKGDSSSLHECSARARSGKSIYASRPFQEMIARPKISQNEWKTAEI